MSQSTFDNSEAFKFYGGTQGLVLRHLCIFLKMFNLLHSSLLPSYCKFCVASSYCIYRRVQTLGASVCMREKPNIATEQHTHPSTIHLRLTAHILLAFWP